MRAGVRGRACLQAGGDTGKSCAPNAPNARRGAAGGDANMFSFF